MAQGLQAFDGQFLTNAAGALVGATSLDGREYLFPTVVNAAAATAQPTTYVPSAVAITGGTVAGAAVTTSTINSTTIGATTRSTVAATTLASTATDSTGTPGNVTNNSANGRAAFAAAGTAVVVTCSAVAAADTVHVTLLGAADATLLYIAGVTVAAGSFTVTGNAAATAAKSFMYTVIKA